MWDVSCHTATNKQLSQTEQCILFLKDGKRICSLNSSICNTCVCWTGATRADFRKDTGYTLDRPTFYYRANTEPKHVHVHVHVHTRGACSSKLHVFGVWEGTHRDRGRTCTRTQHSNPGRCCCEATVSVTGQPLSVIFIYRYWCVHAGLGDQVKHLAHYYWSLAHSHQSQSRHLVLTSGKYPETTKECLGVGLLGFRNSPAVVKSWSGEDFESLRSLILSQCSNQISILQLPESCSDWDHTIDFPVLVW